MKERKYENENVGSQVTDLETSLLPDQVRCIHARTVLYTKVRDRVARDSKKRLENVGESLRVQPRRLGRTTPAQCTAFGHRWLPGLAGAQQPGQSVPSPASCVSPPPPSLGFASIYVSLLEEKRRVLLQIRHL